MGVWPRGASNTAAPGSSLVQRGGRGKPDTLTGEGEHVVECVSEGIDYDGGVQLLLQEGLGNAQHLPRCERQTARHHTVSRKDLTENDDRSGSVPNLLVLSPADLNHGLGCRVLYLDLGVGGVRGSKVNRKVSARPLPPADTSLRMALPSLVITMPPIGSMSICERRGGGGVEGGGVIGAERQPTWERGDPP